MRLRRWYYWGAFLLLLAGCRSEKSVFSFHATPAVEPAAGYASAPVVPAPAVAPVTIATQTLKSPTAPIYARAGDKPRGVPAAVTRKVRRVPAVALRLQSKPSETLHQQQPANRDRLHLLLGAGLIVGGVVAGLLIGGWLGLGVGALIVLLGDYFLVLGIGGKHAWLEIFQEFFNL